MELFALTDESSNWFAPSFADTTFAFADSFDLRVLDDSSFDALVDTFDFSLDALSEHMEHPKLMDFHFAAAEVVQSEDDDDADAVIKPEVVQLQPQLQQQQQQQQQQPQKTTTRKRRASRAEGRAEKQPRKRPREVILNLRSQVAELQTLHDELQNASERPCKKTKEDPEAQATTSSLSDASQSASAASTELQKLRESQELNRQLKAALASMAEVREALEAGPAEFETRSADSLSESSFLALLTNGQTSEYALPLTQIDTVLSCLRSRSVVL